MEVDVIGWSFETVSAFVQEQSVLFDVFVEII
jgi:hypothetical protein